MGYGSNYAYVIEEESIIKIVPKEYRQFQEILENLGQTMDTVASDLSIGGPISNVNADDIEKIYESFKYLKEKFKEITEIGIDLMYHDKENGDRYDEVDGAFWILYWDDVVELTPNVKKLEQLCDFKVKQWVTFG